MATSSLLGKDARVTVEFADGRVMSGNAILYTITVEQDMQPLWHDGGQAVWAGPPRWEATLVGWGPIMERHQFDHQLARERNAAEWRCWHCGAVNPQGRRKCEGCNAYRTVLLG